MKDSANSREIKAYEKDVSVAAKTKESRHERTKVPQWRLKETCVSKNLHETVRLQSEKRLKWIREIKRK